MDEHNITAGLLVKLMSGISEECWCAGWMHNLEYMLWDVVTGRRENLCKPEEIEQLKYLSGKMRRMDHLGRTGERRKVRPDAGLAEAV